MKLSVTFLASVFVLCGAVEAAQGQLEPGRLFTDGAVLQRNVAAPVWGTATPGAEIRVQFDGETVRTTADESGSWRVELSPRQAGGPHQLMIQSESETVRIEDVLVGDVWIASGQSNMEWVVADSKNAEQEIAQADDREIRHFKVPRSWAERPEETLAGGAWEPATSEYVGNFTAVGYYFARSLRQHVDVPIGIVNSTWGGSRIEPWMSAEALGLGSEGVAQLMEQEENRLQSLREDLRAKIGALPETDRGMENGKPLWADPTLDDTDWSEIPVPSSWEDAGYEGLDGVGWYRTAVELSENEATEPLALHLSAIDDSDVTWVNGDEVGRTSGWTKSRVYEVPASALRAGENVIAVRVEDSGGGGGIYGDSTQVKLEGDGVNRSLARPWKFNVGAVSLEEESRKNQVPTLLYNKMIHPLLSYPICGVIWYQGESNGSPEGAFEYRTLFKDMIGQWREDWAETVTEPFPFLWVQLANYMEPSDTPTSSAWAVLRESQHAALSLPKTGQAVAIDIGSAERIHPRNKQDVGRRLARDARHIAYGEDVVYSGPVYEGHRVEGGRVILSFDHVGSGLTTRDGEALQGFAIAGSDSSFVWAEARIEGDQVVVWSDDVVTPTAVRYAWADNPVRANLYNEEGLPTAPFRTDEW